MAPDADVSVDLAAALVQMVELGGSDLLVKVGNRPLVRVDGQLDSLHEAGLGPVEPWETEALLHQVLPQASTTLAAMIEHINQTTRKHVVTIGEMRDEETVRTALAAAETGHLVLSTLHTLNAAESINGRPRASGRISTTRTTTSRPAGWTRHEDLS